jgi:hypothetical protein
VETRRRERQSTVVRTPTSTVVSPETAPSTLAVAVPSSAAAYAASNERVHSTRSPAAERSTTVDSSSSAMRMGQ